MSLRILHQDGPKRSIALASAGHVLIFQYNPSEYIGTSRSNSAQCMVEFVEDNRVDLSRYKPLRHGTVYGTLGLINVEADLFLCVITHASLVATIRPHEHVQRVAAVEFCEFHHAYYHKNANEWYQTVSVDQISTTWEISVMTASMAIHSNILITKKDSQNIHV